MSSDLWYAKFRHYPEVHLFELGSKKCLCGADRETARIAASVFPGWPMCPKCKAERDKRRADEQAADMQRMAAEARNWWLEAKRA